MKKSISGTKPSGAAGVARLIRKYIRENNLKQGDRLPTHVELCRIMDLGIRRLREGLSILEQEGLIITRRKGGTQVSSPSLDYLDIPISWHLDSQGCTFQDLIQARALLEGAIAAEAAKMRKARDLLVILDSIEQMESVDDKIKEKFKEDEAFHLAVLSAAHNPAMEIFGQLIHSQFVIKKREHITANSRRQAVGINEHRQILAAIKEQDPDKAREKMQAHILAQINDKQ